MKYPEQKQKRNLSNFKPVDLIEGETIEDKCKRLVESKEPITDGAPILFPVTIRVEYFQHMTSEQTVGRSHKKQWTKTEKQ